MLTFPASSTRTLRGLRAFLSIALLLAPATVLAQAPEPEPTTPEASASEPDEEKSDTKLVPDLTYEQQPGLAYAASKIYFTDQKYSISGFGEFNVVPIAEGKDASGGDPELYYTGLYRFSTFFGYRIKKNLIFN